MTDGLIVTDDQLVRLGHRVLCLAFAWYEWEKFRREEQATDPIDSLLRFDDDELSSTLLSLASLARALDDQTSVLGEAGRVFPNGVGYLEIDGSRESLSPREACNKIIHASRVNIDTAVVDRNPIWDRWYRSQGHDVHGVFKAPALLLEGSRQNGKGWFARVELVPYAYATALGDVTRWNLAAV